MNNSKDPSENITSKRPVEFYRNQHKLRLSYMPWLFYRLKPSQLEWALPWQIEWQTYLQEVENIQIGENCFIAPEAKLFAEPGRPIVIGDNSFIAADAVLHGPIVMGNHVSVNHHVTMDGGTKGIQIGNHARIAAYATLYAFNHGMTPDRSIAEQPTVSKGLVIGDDVWIGAQAGLVDGVNLGNGCVVGMNAQVTKSFPEFSIIGGNPAKIIGDRRSK